MRRLIVDARMVFSSGIGTYLRNVLKRISEKGGMDFVLLGERSQIEKAFGKDAFKNIVNFSGDVYSPGWHLRAPFTIPDGDIYWSPHYTTPLTPIKPRRRITTIHDIIHLRFPQYYDPFKRLYAGILLKNAVNRSDIIITVSRFTKEELLNIFGIDEEKVRVVYNGVDREFFQPSHDRNLLKSYGIHGEYILYTGNIKPHKNLITLLKAYRMLNVDIPLVIVGRVEGLKKADKRVLEILRKDEILRKRVRILGEVPFEHLPYIYSGALFLVFPSLYEGFGLPPLEALSCGVPAIISDIPVHREIYGNALPMFDPTSPEDLMERMKELLSDNQKRKMYLKSGSALLEKYTWDRSAREHQRIFTDLSI